MNPEPEGAPEQHFDGIRVEWSSMAGGKWLVLSQLISAEEIECGGLVLLDMFTRSGNRKFMETLASSRDDLPSKSGLDIAE